jgi:hypothetical protein
MNTSVLWDGGGNYEHMCFISLSTDTEQAMLVHTAFEKDVAKAPQEERGGKCFFPEAKRRNAAPYMSQNSCISIPLPRTQAYAG